MTNEKYLDMIQYIHARPRLRKGIVISNYLITFCTYAVYILYVLLALFSLETGAVVSIIVGPAVFFILFSIVRAKMNRPRPYELLDFKPLIKKTTKGKSFPSRHVFCIFVIGVSLLPYIPIFGGLLCVFGVLLAIVRVLVGVHFPRDVMAGALCGVICGLISILVSSV